VKILIHSNGPRTGTGYGVQVANLIPRLIADGYEVAVSCTHGQDAGIGMWETPAGDKVRLYPRRVDPSGVDIIHGHANNFFEGDPRAGWIIPLIDVWALNNPYLADFNVAGWAPVDHLDCPPDVTRWFQTTGAVPLAMSRHGEAMMARNGLDPVYIPLTVDTTKFKPTAALDIAGTVVGCRELLHIPKDKFVVGMVAMNKGNVLDRKGFSEALFAFGKFHETHPDSVLFIHTDRNGYQGFNLAALAKAAGIPDGALLFSDQYAYTIGFSPEMMAALYTAFDVLLAPSHGEGFCVPLIEAQACGTPVIASAATAQPELVGAGWLVAGQPVWDESQSCAAFSPYIVDIVARLVEAYDADRDALAEQAVSFAQLYDIDRVYDTYWRPFLATLSSAEPPADKPLMDQVAVVVPAMKRPHRVQPLVDSFNKTNDGTARLYFVCDPDDDDEIAAVKAAGLEPLISDRGHTFAQKANVAYRETSEDWLFICGDDCEFTEGWIAEARKLSDRYDVIGTNDSEPGRVRNSEVAAGRHADHWFTRRAYVEDVGSCLEAPGVFAPECYYHWWVDREIIGLARARGVYGHADQSRVIHHHPGFDGDEAARESDPVYMKAVEWSDRDRTQFMRRVGLIEGQRQTRGRAA
jgi:glycosyltransferase involved in cell wall biosynthesis